MTKPFKIILLVLAALFAILAAGAAWFALTFDPNQYKPQLISLVKDRYQRSLDIPGDIRLRFFPRLGVDLGAVRLSEPKGSASFVSVEQARVSLALLPLLSGNYLVDRVQLKGLNANIVRRADGSTNFDDLLGKDEGSQKPLHFQVAGVDMEKSRLSIDDRMGKRKLEFDDLQLKTGRIADKTASKVELQTRIRSSSPKVDGQLKLESGFRFDLQAGRHAFDKLDANFRGNALDVSEMTISLKGDMALQPKERRFELASLRLDARGNQNKQPLEARLEIPELGADNGKFTGGRIRGEAKLAPGGRNIVAEFNLPKVDGSPQAFSVPGLSLNASIKDAQTDARIKLDSSLSGNLDTLSFALPRLALALSGKHGDTILDGKFSGGVRADLGAGKLDLSDLQASFGLPNPAGGSLRLTAAGSAGADLNRSTASAVLKGKLDDSNFDARLNLLRFSPASWKFNLDVDQLDADRYRAAKTAAPGTPAARDASGKQPASGETPLDLSALRELDASGSVKIGKLKAGNLRLANVQATLKAASGTLDVAPMSASLYGGSLAGSVQMLAAAQPRLALRQTLTGIHVGPLLKDAIGKDPVEGRGNVSMDLQTQGGLLAQWKKNLQGAARFELRDGAVKGFNIAQAIRVAKSRVAVLRGNAAEDTGTGSPAEKTDFSELSGSFTVNRGIAHNEDLRAKSPLMRIEGAGDVNLPADRLDYLVKATVVPNLQGQGGPEMQALRGLTVPVRLSGPFNAIGYRVDVGSIASDLVKKQLDSRKDEVKSRVEEQLKEQLKGLFGR